MAKPHYFEDWEIGRVYETQSRTVTQEDVDHFNAVEGYASDLHNDPETAKGSIFGDVTVHGALILVMASGLMARMQMFDGPALAFLGIGWKFHDPVRVGDTLRVRWWVGSKRLTSKPGRGVIVRHVEVLKQDGKVACTGEFTSLWKCRQAEDAASG